MIDTKYKRYDLIFKMAINNPKFVIAINGGSLDKNQQLFSLKYITMITLRMLIFILLFIPLHLFAGEIYGTIKTENGKGLANRVVQIVQKDKIIGSVTTDENGYFSVSVKENGKCKLVIPGFPEVSFDVFSSTQSTCYNLSLKKEGNKWQLKSL